MPEPPNKNKFESELIIGLVSAVGTENKLVIDLLKERLGRAGYAVELVKISSDVIPQLCTVEEYGDDQFKRYSNLIDAGNKCRALESASDADDADDAILAYGVATYISARRRKLCSEQTGQASNGALSKTAFIIDSLKRPEEVEKLRLTYPSGFILVGVHSEIDRRKSYLVDSKGMEPSKAKELINRDEKEANEKHGQRVNGTFHLADFFVQLTDNHDRLRSDIKRFVNLWFGDPFSNPTFEEYAMFMAFAAALRSADLSRQVGAVIAKEREIIASGANECPAAGGGLYWAERNPETGCIEDAPRGKDYTRGIDSNRDEQVKIIDRIISEAKVIDSAFDGAILQTVLKKSGIRDLTEYGRVVHAEMEALLCCSRNGISTRGATLYCTTFPCHNCAKHLIAAGIKRVVYVEPYSKSKALEFHDDAIAPPGVPIDSTDPKVVFEPFVGVGARRFFEIFSMSLGSSYPLSRKTSETGKKRDWSIEKAVLRLQMHPVSYLELELSACAEFAKKSKRGVNE